MALSDYQHIQHLALRTVGLTGLVEDFKARHPDDGPKPSWSDLARYTSDLEAAIAKLDEARAEATR